MFTGGIITMELIIIIILSWSFLKLLMFTGGIIIVELIIIIISLGFFLSY